MAGEAPTTPGSPPSRNVRAGSSEVSTSSARRSLRSPGGGGNSTTPRRMRGTFALRRSLEGSLRKIPKFRDDEDYDDVHQSPRFTSNNSRGGSPQLLDAAFAKKQRCVVADSEGGGNAARSPSGARALSLALRRRRELGEAAGRGSGGEGSSPDENRHSASRVRDGAVVQKPTREAEAGEKDGGGDNNAPFGESGDNHQRRQQRQPRQQHTPLTAAALSAMAAAAAAMEVNQRQREAFDATRARGGKPPTPSNYSPLPKFRDDDDDDDSLANDDDDEPNTPAATTTPVPPVAWLNTPVAAAAAAARAAADKQKQKKPPAASAEEPPAPSRLGRPTSLRVEPPASPEASTSKPTSRSASPRMIVSALEQRRRDALNARQRWGGAR
jgi:hypothetical protein